MTTPDNDYRTTAGDAGDALPVRVTMTRWPSGNRWISHSWKLTLVRIGALAIPAPEPVTHPEAEDFTWDGLTLRLYRDEAESYYHNLTAPRPSLFVITRGDDQGRPRPVRVSACFDEANAHLEADDDAHALPLPPELCLWLERFVLTHYAPEPRRKRRRRDWRHGERNDGRRDNTTD